MSIIKVVKLLLSKEVQNIVDNIDLPNIPTKTFGGKVFWNELAEQNSWRLQKNMLTKHCRILDPGNYRVAWGGERKMFELFSKLTKKP